MSVARWSVTGAFVLSAALLLIAHPGSARAVQVGDVGPMFQTFDENMQPVDMNTLIDGKPLVIIVGSAS